MILESTLLFCCLFLAWLFYTHYYKPYYVLRKKLHLPGPPPSFFYGNYSEMVRLGYLECMSKWNSQYGPTFVFYLGIMPVVVTTDLEIIKTILVKNFDNFVNRPVIPLLIQEEDKITKFPLMRDDAWRRARRIVVPTFTTKKLKMVAPLIEEGCKRLRNRMAEVSDSNKSIELWKFFRPHTLGIILAIGLGRDIGNSEDHPLTKSAAYVTAALSTNKGFTFRWLQTVLSHFPWSVHIFKFLLRRSEITKKYDYLEKAASKLLEDRRQAMGTTSGNMAKDFLQFMIEAHNENEEETKTKTKNYMSNKEIVGAMIILMTSYDTFSGALSHTAYQLALNPTIQDKLAQEIKEYYEANPDSSLYEAANNIEYVSMVLHESMRMFTPIPGTGRECGRTCTVNGIVMPEGIDIYIPFACIHYNPEYWPDPNTFDPERFRESSSYAKFAYIPFAEGPRHCIGKRLVILITKMSLISMLKEFQFRMNDKTEVPLQFTTDVFTTPKHGINLSIVTRQVD